MNKEVECEKFLEYVMQLPFFNILNQKAHDS